MNKKLGFKLFAILFLLLIFPVDMKAVSLTEAEKREIEKAYFTTYTKTKKQIIFWSLAYFDTNYEIINNISVSREHQPIKVYRNTVLSDITTDNETLKLFEIFSKENDLIALKKDDSLYHVGSFNINNGTPLSKLNDFAKLTVERNDVLSCGKRTNFEYESCLGNDYCNYYCSKMSGEVQGIIPDNTSAYFLYESTWNNCDISDDDCKANKILSGQTIDGFYISNDEASARSSIQARSLRTYSSQCKNVTRNIRYIGTGVDANGVYDSFERSSSASEADCKDANGYDAGFIYDHPLLGNKRVFSKITGYYSNGSKKIYEFSQNAIWRGQKLSASPIKFSYWLAAEIPQSCTIEKNDKKTFSKACTDLNDTIGDEYKCGDTTFDLIKGVGEAKYNPYCYKSCKTTINSENIGSVQGTYKAGMGFDWNFLLGYTKDCSVNILLDKYPSSPSLTDERNLEICYNSIEAGAGDITANIENFRYGNRNFSNLVLNPPPATSIESSTTAKYYNASGTEISVTDPNKATPSELRSKDVSKIQYHYEKPKVAYSTDEFGCVLKSNGLAVRCDTLNDNLEHVLNNTTYPIAFTQHPVLNMPITLNINLGGEKIQRTCHYNITNEIFGKEDEDTPVNCNTTDNCEDLTSTGIDIIYRPISLNNPFPGINGGVNWENNNTNSFGKNWTSDNVDDFILQNRNVENNAVYLLDPLYHLELNLGQIRQIRNYNNEHNYNDFTFNCEEGLECVARENNILRNLDTYAGTCSNVLRSENGQYYTCANKEIPDESEVP